jgi:hypothetical protein
VSISGTESGQDGRSNIEVFIVCNPTGIPLNQLVQVLVMVAATPRNVAGDARAARALIAARAFAISTVYAAVSIIVRAYELLIRFDLKITRVLPMC